MWTLFLIITLNANSDYPTMPLFNQTAIEGGLATHEVGFFRSYEDCFSEALALIVMSQKLKPVKYLYDYKCVPTRSEPE